MTLIRALAPVEQLIGNWRALADGRKAVGVFNFGDQYRALRLDPEALGLTGGAALRDLWRHQALGRLQPGYTASVPAHGVLLLAVGVPKP